MITTEYRLEAFVRLSKEIDEVAKKSQNLPESVERAAYLNEVGGLVVCPASSGKGEWDIIGSCGSEQADEKDNITIYPLFSQDADFGGMVDFCVKRVMSTTYCSLSNFVCINMSEPETFRHLAVGFWHEITHALIAKKEGRLYTENTRQNEDRAKEEVITWTIDYKVMLELGGRRYQKRAKRLAFEISKFWRKKITCPHHDNIGIVLNDCLGPLPSGGTAKSRDNYFWTYCCLMAADYYFPESAMKIKFKLIWDTLIDARAHESKILASINRLIE